MLVDLGSGGPAKSFPKIFIEEQLVPLSSSPDSPKKKPDSQSFKMSEERGEILVRFPNPLAFGI